MPFQEKFQFNQSGLSPIEDDLLDTIYNMIKFQLNTQELSEYNIKMCVWYNNDRGSETERQDGMGFTVRESFLP